MNKNTVVSGIKKYCVKSTFEYPLVIKDGNGCYLTSIDNKKYLDFHSNVSSCNVGYKHPGIMQVLREYSKIGAHKIAGQDFYTEEAYKLAKKIIEITPPKLRQVFLSNSGAEAVENALKFAYRKLGPYTGVGCIGAFHGRTLGALTYTASKAIHKKNYPELDHERIKFCTKDNDPRINDIDLIFKKMEKVAFVLAEPVQGEGGYLPASKVFMKKLRKSTQEHNIPLIIDEVQAGIGRTGKWWGFEHYKIIPDIVIAAKSLQVGASVTSLEYAPKEEGAVSSTWGGGARIDLAIGLKTLEIIEKEKLLKNAQKIGDYFMKRFNEFKDKYENVIGVTGLGLMIGVEMKTREQAHKVVHESFKKGLSMLGCGTKSLRISPPLIITKKEADKGLNIIENCIKKLK